MRHAMHPMLLLLLLPLFAGCYETTFVLGRVEDAKVDAGLVGEWSFDALGDNADQKATLEVSALDAHRYALTWTGADGKTLKMIGFVSEVKGARFVHAAKLDADGKAAAAHWIIRFDLDGDDKLALSNLDGHYFERHKVDSDAALHDAIAAGIDDPTLYVADVMLGTRVKKP